MCSGSPGSTTSLAGIATIEYIADLIHNMTPPNSAKIDENFGMK
jgi:hypothetical protein